MRDFRSSLIIFLLLGLAQSCVSDETDLKRILTTLPSFMIQMGQVTRPPGGSVNLDENCNAIAVDPQDEGIYCAGVTRGDFAEPIGAIAGGTDALLVKFDRNKNFLWARQFGATSYPGETGLDMFTGLAIDSQGFIYASGGNNGVAMVAKFHRKGTLMWRRIIPGSRRCTKIAIQSDRIFCAGQAQFFTQAYEIDSSGNMLWLKQTTGGNELVNGIALDNSGNLFVLGNTDRSLVAGHNPALGKEDGFVWKLGQDGTEKWIDQFGTDNFPELPFSIAIDRNGAIVVGGYFIGSTILPPDTDFDPDDQNPAQENAFIVKYQDTGSGLSEIWKVPTRHPSKSTILSVIIAPDNQIICGGRIIGSLYEASVDGSFDAYILRLSSEGTTLFSRQFGADSRGNLTNEGRQDCSALALDPLGNVICGGLTDGNTNELGGAPSQDIMLWRVGPKLEF